MKQMQNPKKSTESGACQGRDHNTSPARQLSKSFGLDRPDCGLNTTTTLLATVGHILDSHAPYKRSHDAQFKAFVCSGLK
jgi:hypothetical protein